MTPFDLRNKVAFVTGGNGGIGLGMAKGLATVGATVVIAGTQQDQSRRRSGRTEGHGREGGVRRTGRAAGDRLAIKPSIRRPSKFGRLDILINNAGTSVRKPPEALTAADWHLVMNTNLTSAFFCSQAAYPHMQRSRRRQDHQYRFDDVDFRVVLCGALTPRAKAPSCRWRNRSRWRGRKTISRSIPSCPAGSILS